jgi:hypothetical protein
MKERSLEDLELYVYTLRHVVVDCSDDSRDRREGDGAQGDGALEGAESNGDNLAFFVGQLMKTGRGTEVFHMIIGKNHSSHIHTQLMRPVLV